MNIEFTVYAVPQPQGSMKAFVPKSGKMAGRAVLTSDNPRLKSFRQEVASAALNALLEAGTGGVVFGYHVPVRVALNFYFAKPKSVPRKRERHVVPPDLDKLLRSSFDSLTGIIWHDDSQVCTVYAAKFYGLPERVEILVMEAS